MTGTPNPTPGAVSLAPSADGASVALTLSGAPIVSLSIDAHGAPVVTLAPESAGLSVLRDPGPASTGSGMVSDGTNVTFAKRGAAPVVVPVSPATAKTPSGTRPVIGQDDALFWMGWAMAHGAHVALMGPTGTGKTSIVRNVAEVTGWSLTTVSIVPGTEAADLIGEPRMSERDGAPVVEWRDGPVLEAVRGTHNGPQILLLDEATRIANVSHYAGLYSLIDASRSVETDVGRVDRGRFPLLCVLTGNPADDDDGAYLGVTALDPALSNRFGVKPAISWPDASTETKALVSHVPGIAPAVARAMVDTAGRVRAADGIRYPFGMRTLIDWAMIVATTGLSPVAAADVALIQDVNADERAAVSTLVKLVFGAGGS